MCGIAGIWNFNEDLELDTLQRFTDSMIHRGPDGAGYELVNSNLGLGHRRLSILDLSENGKQPMQFAEGRYTITYNGEVYNFIELKIELENLGFTFRTNTDTEVILTAYHKWGKECLFKFNGMFAFAIWDNVKQNLFMVRDRFGVKPLHFLYKANQFFAFASESLAFKYLNNFERKINETNLVRGIINNQQLEGKGYTIYDSIFELLPGHFIELHLNDVPKQIRWWNTFDHLQDIPKSYKEQVEQFKYLFEDACKIRLRSDVPIATALSGGVDSSSVYCMLRHVVSKENCLDRMPNDWQRAVVGVFPGSTNDERIYAEYVVNYASGNAEFVAPNYSNLVDDIIKDTRMFDGICGTPITVASMIYKGMKDNGIIVSLDGHGGDELLYGYTPAVFEAYVQESLYGDELYANDLLDIYINMFDPLQRDLAVQNAKDKFNNILYFEGKFNKENVILKSLKKQIKNLMYKNIAIEEKTMSSWYNYKKLPALKHLSNNPYRFNHLNRADLLLTSNFHINPLPANLRNFDRASMQHSIETRMPLLDWRLVTYCFALPYTSKVNNGYTKRILRDAMKGIMPENIRTRKPKVGLSAPLVEWFNGPLKTFLIDEINSANFIQSPYWNGKKIINFVAKQYKNNSWNKNNSEEIWTILNAHILVKQ